MDLDNKSLIYEDENYEKRKNNTITEEKKIESEIDNKISNVGKNIHQLLED
jgi:hypothetical protein